MLQELTSKIADLAAKKGGVGNSIKFATDSGCIFIDADGTVNNTDAAADCTITINSKNLKDLMAGDLNPMTAMMFGKIKVRGDMSIAMKLQSLF